MTEKLKAAVFALTSCEGCSLMILNLEDELEALSARVEFVNFREAVDARRDDYEIAFVDGAVTQAHEVAELEKIRANARLLVAMGSCAVQGGLYALRNLHGADEALRRVYGGPLAGLDTLAVSPLSRYVKVDYNLYGCPITKHEFIDLVGSVLIGKRPAVPDYPICNECRMSENACVFERGLACMGPVTRAGCGAICPAHATGCCGCRGLVDAPFIASHMEMLREHGLDDRRISEMYAQFNCALRGDDEKG